MLCSVYVQGGMQAIALALNTLKEIYRALAPASRV